MRPEHWLYTIPLRLRSLFRWAQADQELDDEMRDHLERKTEEYVAQGMTQEEAHRRARRCASSCVIPCATYSSVFRSRWSRISSSNSWSACAQRNNDRSRRGIVYSQCSGRMFDSPLLVPQRDHRIDFHRAAGGNVASSESDENQQGGDGHHRERVVRADVIQHRRHETRDAYSGGDADGCADEREQNPLPDDEAREIAMVRAEGHANAELAGAASDFVGQQTVKADAGEHKREGGEETG